VLEHGGHGDLFRDRREITELRRACRISASPPTVSPESQSAAPWIVCRPSRRFGDVVAGAIASVLLDSRSASAGSACSNAA
jgi:hypothetical protein